MTGLAKRYAQRHIQPNMTAMFRFRSRLIALFTAYALALQPVLATLGFSLGAAQASAICAASGGGHDNSSAPASHRHAGCAVCPAAGAGLPVQWPDAKTASVLGIGIAMSMHIAAAPPARAAARAGPARAPPA
jgi:hypothetical protein